MAELGASVGYIVAAQLRALLEFAAEILAQGKSS